MRAGALVLVLFLASPAWAGASATATLEKADARLRELLAPRDAGEDEERLLREVTTELRGLFDLGELARRALVDHWQEMTPDERTRVVDSLRAILERTYIRQLRRHLDYTIQYLGEQPAGAELVVRTIIRAPGKGRPVQWSVDFVLHPAGDKWVVHDVISDEVSMIKNYRSQFNRIIAKEGVEGLIGRMRRKLDEDR